MTTVEVNGTSLFYKLSGQGPPCLVMHGGLGMDHVSCLELDPLGDRMQLVYYDHRGNGRSGRPPVESLTMEQFADDAAALASNITTGKVIVFGHSYGGFIAQEFALRHPERVAALILCDTTPGQLGSNLPDTDEELAAAWFSLLPDFMHRRDPADVEQSLSETVASVSAVKRGFEILGGWSTVDRLSAINAPTLLLVGRHDLFTSPSQTGRIARKMPQAEVVEFSDSGHMPWMDEPARFFEVVGDWLNRHIS